MKILPTLYHFRAPLLAGALVVSGWLYGCEVRRNAELAGELKAKAAALDSAIAADRRAVVRADAEAAPIVAKAASASTHYHAIRLTVPRVETLAATAPVTVPAAFIIAADAAVAAADSARAADSVRIAARDQSIADLNARIVLDAEEMALTRREARTGELKAGAIGAAIGAAAVLILHK